MNLRVGYIKEATRALGPGLRFVIWTQGCQRRCKECISPEYRSLDGGYLVDTNDLADRILACRSLDGISISGGEPFLQAKALAVLLEKVIETRPELTILVYTGNKLEELTDSDSQALLNKIDLLIDGEYIPELNNGKGLRGSSNQKFHFLTKRLVSNQYEFENGERKVEIYWTDNKRQRMVKIGVPRSNRIEH